MTVKEIVAQHLREHGYDGLCNETDCCCKTGDLMPCVEWCAINCKPGYLGEDEDGEWIIQEEKP